MGSRVILNVDSLGETLWRLEEARLDGVSADSMDVQAALSWVVGRIGLRRSYRGIMPSPTERDMAEHRTNPTGERFGMSNAGTMHILGEEAVRALCLWGRGDSGQETVSHVLGWGEAGHFCCGACSVARWRCLAAARPTGWEDDLAAGLKGLAAEPLAGGRWQNRPFYYTLLTLSEIPLPEAFMLGRIARPSAERALSRLTANDRISRFRRLGLEWATNL